MLRSSTTASIAGLMLRDFFRLNQPFTTYAEPCKLRDHFRTANDLKDVLYQPDRWPDDLKKIKSASFKNVSFAKTVIEKVTFTECVFEDCLFIGATIKDAEFHRCKFKNCNFYKSVILECYLDPLSIEFDRRYKRTAANIGTSTFQTLMKNSVDMDQPFFKMNSDILFRRWKRAQLFHDLNMGRISKLQFVRHYLGSLIYEYSCGFGYKPFNFIITTALVFISIAAINMSFFYQAVSINEELVGNVGFIDSIFFTFSVMTSLGFSSIVPVSSLAKILAVSEALVGIGWLGLFTSILVKRFLQ